MIARRSLCVCGAMVFGVVACGGQADGGVANTQQQLRFHRRPRHFHHRPPPCRPKVPRCTTASSGDAVVNASFAGEGTVLHASFQATPGAAGMDGVIGLSSAAATTDADLAAAVRFDASGIIEARQGDAYGADVAVPYAAGTSLQIDIVVDIPAHRYSAYVDGRLLARNYAFRTEQSSVTALSNEAIVVNSSGGSLTVCDFAATHPPGATFLHDTLLYGPPPVGGSLSLSASGNISMAGADQTFVVDAAGDVLATAAHGGTVRQDATGDIYLFGTFAGMYDGGTGPVASAGGTDVYVSKYDARFMPLWTLRFGGADDDALVSPTVSPEGRAAALVSSPNTESLVRLNADGAVAPALTVDARAVAYVSGGGFWLGHEQPGTSLVISKYTAGGAALWNLELPATGAELDLLRSDASGDVLIAGRLNGSIDFGAATLTTKGSDAQAFLAELDANGDYVYATLATMNLVSDVSVDADGNAFVSGTASNPDRPRLNEIDPSGALVFESDETLIAPLATGQGGAVAADASGNVYWQLSGSTDDIARADFLAELAAP